MARPGRPVHYEKLWNEAHGSWTNLIDISDVSGALGFDFHGDAPTPAQVQSLVNAHDPTPPSEQAAVATALAQLRNTFDTPRTLVQVNNSIDAVTVLLRRIYQELQ